MNAHQRRKMKRRHLADERLLALRQERASSYIVGHQGPEMHCPHPLEATHPQSLEQMAQVVRERVKKDSL